jgi:hypothetical protein
MNLGFSHIMWNLQKTRGILEKPEHGWNTAARSSIIVKKPQLVVFGSYTAELQ